MFADAFENGLVMATGHFRNGVLLAPLTAFEVTEILTGVPDRPADSGPFAAFRPDRFTAPVAGSASGA